jgi:hypothetical protein
MRRLQALALIALLPLGAACAPLLFGGAAGVLISTETTEAGVRTAHVEVDVERAWQVSRDVMNESAWKIDMIEDFPRRIQGEVGNADVSVQVEAYDIGRSVIRVEARKFMVANSASAKQVMDKIIARLNETRQQ